VRRFKETLLGDLLTRVARACRGTRPTVLEAHVGFRVEPFRDCVFECFDLLCRTISEPVAVRHLEQLDQLKVLMEQGAKLVGSAHLRK
jgi:hypothetical protein